MTKQEIEELTTRLTRIWRPYPSPRTPKCIVETDFYSFSYRIEAHVLLLFVIYEGKASARLEWDSKCCEMECKEGEISSYWTVSNVSNDLLIEGALDQFTQRWLEAFRCGCWLSGFPVEATAYEKIKWTQNLTHKEIEAWNLDAAPIPL